MNNRRHNQLYKAKRFAAKWMLRVDSGKMTNRQWGALDKWLDENPGHQAEYDISTAIWDRTEQLEDHPLVAAELTASTSQTAKTKRSWFGGTALRAMRFRPVAIAATVVLAVISGWIVSSDMFFRKTDTATTYRTEIGTQKPILLADGSSVILDTDSLISTDFSDDARNVTLIYGRALFSVVRDLNRPFIVTVDDTELRALGTEFDVFRQRPGKITLAVLEGAVRVSKKPPVPHIAMPDTSKGDAPIEPISAPKADPMPPVEIVTSGKQILIDEHERQYVTRPAEIDRINAWRSGKLDFKRIPLGDVITEINRYLTRKLEIDDDELNEMRISMLFYISDSDHFLSALENSLPIVSKVVPLFCLRLWTHRPWIEVPPALVGYSF